MENLPGAIPLTLIPRGSSSRAREEVACPIALFENIYGYESPEVAESCITYDEIRVRSRNTEMTFVHPFILLVMITCGTNFLVAGSSDSFHFSSNGKKANVSQYGPTAFVLRVSLKDSWVISSKKLET